MKELDLQKYRALLMAKHEEIIGKSSQREGIRIVPTNEQIEMVQLAGQREIAAFSLERDAKRLTQIGAAIKRIDDGEFGICVDCEEAISPKRLTAVPWAACCLQCQEIRDAEEPVEAYRPQLAA